MVQPPPPNPDNDLPPQQTGVQQDISDGSSNQGSIQGASAGRDSNQIHGDANQITQIQNFFILSTRTWSRLGKLTIPLQTCSERKAFRFCRAQSWMLAGLILVSSLSATVITTLQGRTLLGTRKPLLICNDPTLPQELGTIRIAIADFADDEGKLNSSKDMEELLKLKLISHIQSDVVVCRTEQVVRDSDKARQIGKALGVAVVIWGSRNSVFFFGGVEMVNSQQVSHILPQVSSAEARSFYFQTENLPKLVALLTKLTLSEIYFLDNEFGKARETLISALKQADREGLNERNASELAKAYFFLGVLFDTPPNIGCKSPLNCQRALEAYKQALALDETLHWAYLNQAKIYERLQQTEPAMQAYSQIIESDSPLATTALVNRAFLHLQQGNDDAAKEDFKSAIERDPVEGHQARADAYLYWWKDAAAAATDLQIALEKEPNNPENYNRLGLVQLKAGWLTKAQKTYNDALPYLDKEWRGYMLEDLENLAQENQENPELTETINSITAVLKVALIP